MLLKNPIPFTVLSSIKARAKARIFINITFNKAYLKVKNNEFRNLLSEKISLKFSIPINSFEKLIPFHLVKE